MEEKDLEISESGSPLKDSPRKDAGQKDPGQLNKDELLALFHETNASKVLSRICFKLRTLTAYSCFLRNSSAL